MSNKRPSSFALLYDLDKKKDQPKIEDQQESNQATQEVVTLQPTDNQATLQPSNIATHPTPDPVGLLQPNPLATKQPSNPPKVKWEKDETFFPTRTKRGNLHVRIPLEKLRQYRVWCAINGFDMQTAVEMAMDDLTGGLQATKQPSNQNTLQPSNIGSKPTSNPHDHDLNNDLIDDISSFYEKWTNSKFTNRDRAALGEIAHLSQWLIKIGIFLSAHRTKTKVNSLRYCFGAIQEAQQKCNGDPQGYFYQEYKRVMEGREA